jgi:DNA polymerase-3 subunit beta
MEFVAKKSDLFRELNLTQGVVEKRATIPILSNVLLDAAGAKVQISATDLELGFQCTSEAKVKTEGSVTVPAKRLLEIVRSLPEAEIKFNLLDNHWVQINCERSSFKLVGMARDNYPALPAIPKPLASIPGKVLLVMIQRTIFSISNEESRYTLNGALLVLKPESAAMVATDGHRLAMIESDVQVEGLKNELRVLLPKKAMGELDRLLNESEPDTLIQFSKDENHLFFSIGERTLISRMLTGQFPNYEAVLPRENHLVIELEKNALTDAIRRVALLADERSRAIRLQLDKDKMEIFSSSGDFGEAHETLEVQYPGQPLQIGFNYQYLLDFLSVVGDGGKVRLELKDEQSAGQLRPVEDKAWRYRYVVMPMRV